MDVRENNLTQKEKKLFVPKGEERNDEMRGKKRNKIIIRRKENLEKLKYRRDEDIPRFALRKE